MPKIAVVGVKETTGREFLNLLSEDNVPLKDVVALEAKAPLGTLASYGEDDEIDVINLENYDFSQVDVAVFATTKELGKRYLNKAKEKGCQVIDLTGASFTDSSVPLVVPGINLENISKDVKVVGVPNAMVYQVLLPLAKTIKQHKLKRLVINMFVSTSYYGHGAMDELFSQSRKIFLNESLADEEKVFNKQIAFNVLPQVGEFIGDETSIEWSVNAEIKKILNSDIKVHANAAFVPTFIGDAAFVNAEFEDDVDADEIRDEMKTVNNVVVFDKKVDGGFVSVDDVQGEDSVYVSRVRQDVSVENGISFWSVADNLRAGGAKLAMAVMTQILAKK